MNETLILLLGDTPDAPVRYAFLCEGRIVLADVVENAAALSGIAARAGEARLVAAILRGEHVAMRSLPAPPRAQGQFRAAAGLLLEDELAEKLETVHVAVSRHVSGAGIALAVKNAVLDDWLSAFNECGIAPDVVTADFSLLPMAPGRAVFVEMPDRIFGAAGLAGFSMDRPLADDIAASLGANDDISEIVVYGGRTIDMDGREGVTVDWRGALDDDALFGLMHDGLAMAPNLLQGEYRKKRDWRAAAGPWRRAGLLAAASIAALLLVNVAGLVRDLRIAERLQQDTLALHATAFPDAADADPRAHARQVLGSGGGGGSFLTISNAFADTLEGSNGVQIDRIRYNGARDEYAVNLRFGDISQIETLKRRLEARGLRAAETGSVRRAGGAYIGELRVSAS